MYNEQKASLEFAFVKFPGGKFSSEKRYDIRFMEILCEKVNGIQQGRIVKTNVQMHMRLIFSSNKSITFDFLS